MKCAAALTLLILVANAHAEETNPLGKVIELIDSLSAKVTADGEAEAKAYKQFFEWCDDTSKNLNFEIKTGTAQSEKLTAKIKQLASDIEAGETKIGELASSISTDEADLKAATEIRKKEASDFAGSEAELVDAVDTLGRAIGILKREMAKNPAALAQIDNSNINTMLQSLSTVIDAASFAVSDRQKLLALVQSQQANQDEDGEPGAPAAAVYKTHSTDIFDVLEDMKEKAEAQLDALRKAEGKSAQNYNMLKQSLEAQLAADNKDKDETTADKSADEESKADAEGELEVTTKELKDAKAKLGNTNSDCIQTAADHEASVRSRGEELAAIAEAKKILVETSKGAVEQTYSLLQVATRARLQTSADLAGSEVVVAVKRLAEKHRSGALAQLASRVAAVLRYGAANGADPFVKVRGLIQSMIEKLEAEAQADATEKAYCDEQMAKTEAKKSDLEDDVSKLTAKIDQAAARSADLKEQVKELEAELAALARQQAEMDKIRQDEHAAFSKAKADLELGLSGVRKALGVLRDYYGSGAAMLQQPEVPTHSKSSGAGGSIIDILEVCESDFAANLAKEETEESDSQSQYDKLTQENKVTKATKEQDVKYKTQESSTLDKNIVEMSADRKAANTELSAVLEYYEKIKTRCIAKPETYEERKRRREEEIAGLKEALSILENETALLQQHKRRNGRHMRGALAA